MASMTPGCILSISSKMKTEEGQALTLPRIQFCSCSWNKRLKVIENKVFTGCTARFFYVTISGDTLSNPSIPHSLAGEWKRKKDNGTTQHIQTNVQPELEQQSPWKPMPPPIFSFFNPCFYGWACGMEYLCWSVRVSCPGCAPPHLLPTSACSIWVGKTSKLWSYTSTNVTGKTPLCSQNYQRCFSHKYKMRPLGGCGEGSFHTGQPG